MNKADPLADIDLNGLWQMQQRIHACMEEKGFHEGRTGNGRDDTLVRLCLIHTEVSEAADVVKKKGISLGKRWKHLLEPSTPEVTCA